MLSQRSRGTYVRENNADICLDTTGREVIKAVLAKIRVLARGPPAHEPEQLATDAGERVLTQLASGIVRKSPKDTLRHLDWFITVNDQRLPIKRFPQPEAMAHLSTFESYLNAQRKSDDGSLASSQRR